VELGKGADYTRVVASDQYDLQHSAVVAGLLPGTQYHYRAASADMSGNGPSYSPDATFSTSESPDGTPPVILGTRMVSIGRDNATIEVTLSEPGTLAVDYGAGKGYGSTAASPAFLNVHIVRIGHLEPGRTYHYMISATDASGNGPTVGTDRTFRTAGAAGAAKDPLGSAPSAMLLLAVIAVLAIASSWNAARRR
jgi:phosphodiesterase/alkaline phosphatase D-like protein